jgi:hypothetical protein
MAENARLRSSRSRIGVGLMEHPANRFKWKTLVPELAPGQYRGEFTRAAYGGAEVDQGLLYGFER